MLVLYLGVCEFRHYWPSYPESSPFLGAFHVFTPCIRFMPASWFKTTVIRISIGSRDSWFLPVLGRPSVIPFRILSSALLSTAVFVGLWFPTYCCRPRLSNLPSYFNLILKTLVVRCLSHFYCPEPYQRFLLFLWSSLRGCVFRLSSSDPCCPPPAVVPTDGQLVCLSVGDFAFCTDPLYPVTLSICNEIFRWSTGAPNVFTVAAIIASNANDHAIPAAFDSHGHDVRHE